MSHVAALEGRALLVRVGNAPGVEVHGICSPPVNVTGLGDVHERADAPDRGVPGRERGARALRGGRGAVQRAEDRARGGAGAVPAGVRRAGAPGRRPRAAGAPGRRAARPPRQGALFRLPPLNHTAMLLVHD